MVNKKKLLLKILARVFIWSVLIVMYMPIMLLVIFSFSETKTIQLNNFKFGFGLYKAMFQNADIMQAVANTLIIAAVAAFIATIIGTMACVGILSMRKRTRSAVMSLNQVAIINADIVIAFSLVLFFVMLGIIEAGWFKLILAHTLIAMPFVVLTVLPRMRQLDPNLYDAGVDLGATPMQALFTVVIPQLLPAMISGFLLGFTLSLDDFIITQYNNGGVQTISTLVFSNRKGPPAEFRALSALVFAVVVIALVVMNLRAAKKNKRGKPK